MRMPARQCGEAGWRGRAGARRGGRAGLRGEVVWEEAPHVARRGRQVAALVGMGWCFFFFLFDEMFFCRRLNLLHVKMEMSPMKMIFVGLCVQVVLPLTLRKLFLAAYRKTIFLVKARRKRSPWQRSRYAGVAIWRAHASNETGARARLAPLHAFFPLFLCFFLLSPSFSLFFFFFASSSHVFPFFRFPPFF